MVWYVNKYKITFKLVINHWTNEILQHIVVSSGPSWPSIIDARARYRATARRLRHTATIYKHAHLQTYVYAYAHERNLLQTAEIKNVITTLNILCRGNTINGQNLHFSTSMKQRNMICLYFTNDLYDLLSKITRNQLSKIFGKCRPFVS